MDTVLEINSLEELRSLKPVWEWLYEQTPRATFYHSFEWLELYCRSLDPCPHLRTLFVTESQEAIGILPLIERDAVAGSSAGRTLECPWTGYVPSDHPLGPQPAETMRRMSDYLVRFRYPEWDKVVLRLGDLVECCGPDRKQPHETVHRRFQLTGIEHHSWLHCQTSFDRYWHARGWEFRRAVDDAEMQLAAAHKLEFFRLRPADDQPDDAATAEQLFALWNDHRQGGTHADGTSRVPDSSIDERDLFQAACRAGCVDLSWLSLDGRPAVIAYGFQCGGYIDRLRFAVVNDAVPSDAVSLLARFVVSDSYQRADIGIVFDDVSTFQDWMTDRMESRELVLCSGNGPRRALNWLRDRIPLSRFHARVAR